MDLENISLLQIFILFVFGGGLIAVLRLLWIISKRDFVLDNVTNAVTALGSKVDKIENNAKTEDDELEENFRSSETRIIDIEKDLIEIKSNQKNLLYSIDSQNFQILDLIERLERNHEAFIKSQEKINDKLESAINAIKDSLINLSK